MYEKRIAIPGTGLKIRNIKGEEFTVYGDVSRAEDVYYCGGYSWPEEIVTEVIYA